jgi:hypothetical protein
MDGAILKSVFPGGVLPIFFFKSQKGDGTEQQCLFEEQKSLTGLA